MDTTATRVKQMLIPLRRSVVKKPPYLSGTLQPPASSFSLFYKITKDDHASRHIDLAHAPFNELEQLAQACEPTAFGVDSDYESSVKAGKMDVGRFAPLLALDHTGLDKLLKDYHFEGSQAKNKLTIELLKLNVYGQGSFADPHVYPPHRVGQRVGSLIIIFPTPHEGGTFFLTHENNKWFFDDGPELAAAPDPTIGYVAFFGDISHAVTPVISGHCVTLTYELYLGDVEPVPGNGSASGNLIPRAHERAFRENLEALLENPEFLPDGGTLGFGLRHVYPINDGIKHVYGLLKGSDAVMYRSARALGFEPLLYMIYEWEPPDMKSTEGGLIERLVEFANYYPDGDRLDLTKIIRKEGGIVVCQDLDSYLNEDGAYDRPEKIEWVTPNTTYNEHEGTYLNMMGNEPALGFVYGNFCLVVRIGKAGERLTYPTSAQLEKVWEKEGNKRPSAFWRR
ncbi:hypothetical protein BC827DRAFT_1272991 [Russula dissimulans]|nr:hypothetical protein BC827DRAFT_1272991 [Russula dissimulans]